MASRSDIQDLFVEVRGGLRGLQAAGASKPLCSSNRVLTMFPSYNGHFEFVCM